MITVYYAFSCCFTLSRRPVTAAVPTYLSNLPSNLTTYGRRRVLCARVRLDGTATADGRHRLLNRSWKNRFGCPWTHIPGSPPSRLIGTHNNIRARSPFSFSVLSFFLLLLFLSETLSRALFRSYLAVGKRRLVEGKGGELAQRRYTTAAATHVVSVCVFYFSKHKEYYTKKFFTSESFFASAAASYTTTTAAVAWNNYTGPGPGGQHEPQGRWPPPPPPPPYNYTRNGHPLLL